MSRLPSFDDFDDDGVSSYSDYKPFAFRDKKGKDETLIWLNENFDQCYMSSRERLLSYRRISTRYKNGTDANPSGFIRESHRDLGTTNNKPKVRTNFYYQYIDQKVSNLAKMRLNLKFIPHNDTNQDDINDAEACNTLVSFRMRQLNISKIMSDMDRMTFKYGTAFAKVYWDKSAGPIDPKYKEAIKIMGKVPILNAEGKPTNKSLNAVTARLGDVCIKLVETCNIFPERYKKCWKDINFLDEVEFVSKDELEEEYPNKDIRKEEYNWLDIDSKGFNNEDMIAVHHFYHKPTKYLPNGIYIKYCESSILEWVEDAEELVKMMPDHELPFVPDFDMELDDEFWARPFLINIEQLNNMHDLIQSGIARNVGVASHPKLLIAEGSVNLKQANNEYGVMQWRGPNKPEWLQHQYVNRGEFEIQDRLEKKMNELSKVFDISKGQVPAGITAASALRLLEDQEITANQSTVEKKRDRVKAVYWKTMLMMDANYNTDDERMVTILGEDNEYQIRSFKGKPNFEKLASVEMEYVSSLSDSRSGRVADIIDLNAANQKEPTFGRKEIIKLLDLGLEDAFKEEVSYGAVTAKTILEKLKRGEECEPPEETDDLIEMYFVFSRFVESINYKMKLNPQTKQLIKDYIFGMEYLMTEKAKKNILFSAKVKGFDKFPMFFIPGAEITMQPMMDQPQTASPGGDQQFKGLNKTVQQTMEDETGGIL
jgi:hypothetical protein